MSTFLSGSSKTRPSAAWTAHDHDNKTCGQPCLSKSSPRSPSGNRSSSVNEGRSSCREMTHFRVESSWRLSADCTSRAARGRACASSLAKNELLKVFEVARNEDKSGGARNDAMCSTSSWLRPES